ncbi:uncharacterized protein PHALS_15141 [Plasmopara halstedii]|uniref:Uncharacterized protein n=1 Tax=Plasmopara halstedii TaxID=4781 RepID=A0A0P1AB38_PLAHL|nr:uncharacterized protein PHALS_15141 [Plasmopara halstedii]CEG38046.1 hypothetical protein PHALS_15141 [Plasmopara halstedii]|eukprot:XP_024574415.1 hypothetical protein PHALS_15141 [Plasmopara halstedii]
MLCRWIANLTTKSVSVEPLGLRHHIVSFSVQNRTLKTHDTGTAGAMLLNFGVRWMKAILVMIGNVQSTSGKILKN